ncbi:toll/interleukin-1 receptor domain-containing protein [Clostridium cellulovorans]|uniref:TIR protein n=1 Tax=Clostridium cellulovorans (strain ATCC 35296 / DSM 3052 / OCM 3 / 743B) TaxID=573061 RepID=D9SP51_CLOC7|nr:toll/interleukin-1 receptor domain-containing protein [Clostridium cellulovorans]ADL52016.1 TIR protein [Clostridium cellulovorans 743B]
MSKVFLSHSSCDKEFVRPIAELFGKDRCIFDEVTFEGGMKNIDEIFRNMDNTDIFVYFISDYSLNSDWVKIELNNAQEKLYSSSHRLKQIFPIIIDPKIMYSDKRIADFIKAGFNGYNLRHINHYKLAYEKIISQMINLQMSIDSKFAEKKNLFYGRDAEIKKFKERYDDSSRNPMKCLVVSGIEGIGRRSFVREVLKSAKIIKSYYFPATISLSRNESIEDLIIKISNLGFGKYSLQDIISISSLNSKVELLSELLLEVQRYNEHIVIYDDKCLINLDRSVKLWFEEALKKIKNEIVISIASNIKLDSMKYRTNDDFFFIDLSGLEKSECAGLLRTYAELEGVNFERDDIKFIQGSLTGYPPQIMYCVDLVKEYDIMYLKNNPHKIVDYSSDKASAILNAVIEEEKEDISYGFLSFLSEYDTVPSSVIYEIFKINPLYEEIFRRFIVLTIVRCIGASNEYIKVNSVIQDYILRNKYSLPKDILNYLKEKIKEFNQNIDNPKYTDFIDFTELSYYIKENMKNDEYVPNKFLYSTLFLRSIVELYNDMKIDKVITIIKGLKNNGTFEMYDPITQSQIQYYYCLALARKDSNEFNEQVGFFRRSKFNKDSKAYINYNFLKGFNYRLSGQLEFAENSFRNVISKNRNHSRAKRELATVYILLEQYDLAFDLSKHNYKKDLANIYQMQAYFECLVRKNNLSLQEKKELDKILSTVNNLYSERQLDIFYQMNALYKAFIENRQNEAIQLLKEGLTKFDTSTYLLKELFDIYRECGNLTGMKNTLESLASAIKDGRSGFENIYVFREAIYEAYSGKSKADIEINLNRRKSLSHSIKTRILSKVDDVISKRSL